MAEEVPKNTTVHRKRISGYEVCFEIWHTHDSVNDETTILHKTVYMHNDAKIRRSQVPLNLLVQFDAFVETMYYDYIDELDMPRGSA